MIYLIVFKYNLSFAQMAGFKLLQKLGSSESSGWTNWMQKITPIHMDIIQQRNAANQFNYWFGELTVEQVEEAKRSILVSIVEEYSEKRLNELQTSFHESLLFI